MEALLWALPAVALYYLIGALFRGRRARTHAPSPHTGHDSYDWGSTNIAMDAHHHQDCDPGDTSTDFDSCDAGSDPD